MKLLGLLLLLTSALSFAAPKAHKQKIRKIEFETKQLEDGVHWMPESITVTQGEVVQFIVKHTIPGKDEHGFFIPELKIKTVVKRGKTEKITKEIPTTLPAGEYKVLCDKHEGTHKPATLVVKEMGAT